MDQKPKPRKPRPRRQNVAYETRTPEKVAMGQRMVQAREVAGLTAADAAAAMGYAQAVQLSNMETGKRPVTVDVLVKAAALYGTTTDYLLGLSEDVVRDPAIGVQNHVAAKVASEVQRLIGQLSSLSVDMVRKALPDVADATRQAQQIFELKHSVDRFMNLNPEFIDAKGGAVVLSRLAIAVESAQATIGRVDRLKRAAAYRSVNDAMDQRAAQISMLPMLDGAY